MTLKKLQKLENNTALYFEGDPFGKYIKVENGICKVDKLTDNILSWEIVNAIGINRWGVKHGKQ